jgi:hypothetical protein
LGKTRKCQARRKLEKEKFALMKKKMYKFSLVENGSDFVKNFRHMSKQKYEELKDKLDKISGLWVPVKIS